MKIKSATTIMLVFLSLSVQAQWYSRHHGVNDPTQLSLEQLSSSKEKATINIITGSIIIPAGAFAFFGGAVIYGLAGENFGLAILLAGIVAVPTGLIMLTSGIVTNSQIKKTKKLVFPNEALLNIQPTIINTEQQYLCPGITISVSF